MLKIGITGNIGSGKTMVAQVFSVLGIPVYHADEESKKMLDNPAVKNEILKHFGYRVLTTGHEINKRSLASLAFTDEEALRTLNSILHPRIRRNFREWTLSHTGRHYVIMEAAIIFESGFRPEFDYVIHVSCPREIAIDRVVKRDRIDVNSVLLRMQFQLDDAEKSRLSDFIIRNQGSEMVLPQVLSIHQQLSEIGTKGHDDVPAGTADA